MSPPDDNAALLERPAARQASVAALMALHERDVRSALRRVLGRSRDEDDLVQEVFTRLVVRLRQPGEINAGAWLRGVARNLAVDEIRRRRPVPVEQARLDRACAPSTDEGVAQSELYTCLVDGAQRLPDRQRAALAASLASAASGAGVAGVASSLGVSVHAAESLLSRARVGLRSHLAGSGHGADAGRVRVSTGTALGAVAVALAALGRRWRTVAAVLAMAGGAASLTGAVVLPALGQAAPPLAVTAAPSSTALEPTAPAEPAPGQPEAAAPQAGAAAMSAAPPASAEVTGSTGTGEAPSTVPLAGLALPAVADVADVPVPVDVALPDGCVAVAPPADLPTLPSGLLDTAAGTVCSPPSTSR